MEGADTPVCSAAARLINEMGSIDFTGSGLVGRYVRTAHMVGALPHAVAGIRPALAPRRRGPPPPPPTADDAALDLAEFVTG